MRSMFLTGLRFKVAGWLGQECLLECHVGAHDGLEDSWV